MKVISAHEAARLVQNDWVVTSGGFGHCGAPEALFKALEQRYVEGGSPTNLTLFFASGPGNRDGQGIDRLAHKGLLKSIVGGFWSLAPRLGKLAQDDEIEAHNWPQGVVSHMFRAIASGKPGVLTDVGLHTFIDPALDGGRLNARTSMSLVDRVDVVGRPSLLYRAMPLNCALLRGTRADENGNISMEREANIQDVLAQAQAVRNSGGIVIVQVLEVAKAGSLPLASVRIPGFLVDYVVVAKAEDHWQTYGEEFNPTYSGQWLAGVSTFAANDEPVSAKRIVARRALLELLDLTAEKDRISPLVVNLGIGTPEWVAREARLNGLSSGHGFTLTVESGAAGGFPAGGHSFGATQYPDALLTQAEQFDHYDGGGIDIAFLGFGQIDSRGRINVASLGGRVNGVGGFINISQAAKRVVFCGTFTAGGLSIDFDASCGLTLTREGRARKFVNAVERVCFDPGGRARCTTPLVITERGVFRITREGVELIEVAPGIDVTAQILAVAGFDIRVSKSLRTMPSTAFGAHRLSYPFAA